MVKIWRECLEMTSFDQNNQDNKQGEGLSDFDKDIIGIFKRIDYWHYKQKVNVIPANYLTKLPRIEWEIYQKIRVSDEQLEKWKIEKMFDNGFVLFLGRTYDKNKTLYLICVDCDEKQSIEEILSIDNKPGSIKPMSEKYLIEQHNDNPNSLHLYFLSPIPFPSKAKDQLIGLEVRSNEKLLIFPAPNLHQDGHQWKILGVTDPPILTTEQAKIWLFNLNNICNKHGLSYLDQKKSGKIDNRLKKMIKNLEIDKNSNFRIYEGERHSKLISIANSLLFTHLESDHRNLDNLKDFFDEIGQMFCYPSPLPEKERESIWYDSVKRVKIYKNANSNFRDSNEITDWIKIISESILTKYNFVTLEETKEILYYENGVYKYGGEILIEKEAETIAGYHLCNHDLREITSHIMRRTYHKRIELDSNGYLINVSNGLYNWKENKLYPHSPDYISTKQKPIFYDPKAKPKLFGKFLAQVLYPGNIRTGIESMAYTFLNDCPFEYFFVLLGEGSNGKSVFTGILTALHSASNVSNVSIKSLLENNFALADLEFKDVNIDEELSDSIIKDISILKKLTGGRRQLVRIERKYRDAYGAPLYAKLFFNTNKIIQTTDQTNAFYRRLIIISFPNTFEEEKQDPNLLKKLTSETEVSGIFNLLMYYLRLIVDNNVIYLDEKSIAERRLKHERLTNPVKVFLNEAMAEDSLADDYVPKAVLYRAYTQFCNEYKLPVKSQIGFGKEISRQPVLRDGKESRGERRTIWLGIKLNPEYLLDIEQTVLHHLKR